MPSFCRHNRLLHNCPICAREQSVELRPVVSSGPSAAPPAASRGGASTTGGRSPRGRRDGTSTSGAAASGGGGGRRATSGRTVGLRVRHLARGVDDGYASPLVPGLRSSEDARRLAEELAFSTARLERLQTAPWDVYAEAADPTHDLEERTWLCLQIACLGPVDGGDPWALVRSVRTTWASGELPAADAEALGRRATRAPDRVFAAYRAWAQRNGSQAGGVNGELGWSPTRRFGRVYERLALPGLDRDPRYELLVVLGSLGLYSMSADTLHLGRDDEVTVAAKRVFGIGDPLLLERRAADLAEACDVPLAALDLALFSWGCGERPDYGLGEGPDREVHRERVLAALDVEDAAF